MTITACVGVNEGLFTLIIATNSYVKPNVTYTCLQSKAMDNYYTKYDIQCHMVFYVTMVPFWMTLLMNK